ncbi:MAG: NUDIX hydrolase [Actinomycetota bacterium]
MAAGGLVLRPALTGHEVMLVHRVRYRDWSFPKGKVERGETAAQAALREVREETALRCELAAYLGTVTYLDEAASPKLAHYWVMTVVGADPFVPDDEIADRRWFSIPRAAEVLTRGVDRGLLRSI